MSDASQEIDILLTWKEENAGAHREVMRKLVEIGAAQAATNAALTASNAVLAASTSQVWLSAAAWGGFVAATLIALPVITNLVPLIAIGAVALTSFVVA